MFPEAKPRETLKSREDKTRCFLRDQSLSVLLYFLTQLDNTAKKSFALCRLTHKFAAVQEARPDCVRIKSSSCCFPKGLVSFDPPYVTRSLRIGKRI